jgi:hypothetical protein
MTNKAFVIEPDRQSAGVFIRYQGGGEVPGVLEGLYTTRQLAKDAIIAYLATQPPRDVEIVDAQAEAEKALQERRGPGRPKKEIQPI